MQLCLQAILEKVAELSPGTLLAELKKQDLTKWLVIADQVVEPSRVVSESGATGLEPFLYHLPTELVPYQLFLEQCGTNAELDEDMLINLLQEVADKYNSRTLSDHDCKVVETAAKLLYDKRGDSDVIDSPKKVFLPNKQKVMHVAKDLSHDSCPWLTSEAESGQCLDEIPYPHANYLGVQTHKDIIIQKHSHGIPFGQSEDLTTRLEGLLRGYPLGHAIFREQIQNADDSNATEIHFILDPRVHRGKKIFDANWNRLQGPALSIWNNGLFTSNDLKGRVTRFQIFCVILGLFAKLFFALSQSKALELYKQKVELNFLYHNVYI